MTIKKGNLTIKLWRCILELWCKPFGAVNARSLQLFLPFWWGCCIPNPLDFLPNAVKIAWEPHIAEASGCSEVVLPLTLCEYANISGSLANYKQFWTKRECMRPHLYECGVTNLYFKVPCWMLGCYSPEIHWIQLFFVQEISCGFSQPRSTPTCGPEKSTGPRVGRRWNHVWHVGHCGILYILCETV